MFFETQRLIVRPFIDSDRDEVLELLYDEGIKKTYMIPDFKSTDEAENLFKTLVRLSDDPDRYVGAICLDGSVIGFMNDTDIDNGKIEMGYVISPRHQNKGYCTEAVKGAVSYLFENGFSEVICGAFEENKASIRVMQKCGMIPLEKKEVIEYRGKRHGCIYYSLKK